MKNHPSQKFVHFLREYHALLLKHQVVPIVSDGFGFIEGDLTTRDPDNFDNTLDVPSIHGGVCYLNLSEVPTLQDV